MKTVCGMFLATAALLYLAEAWWPAGLFTFMSACAAFLAWCDREPR